MKFALKNAKVYQNGSFETKDVAVADGKMSFGDAFGVFEFNNCYVFPGFVDVHVHLREPGFSYKETILSGTSAAAAGGYTSVCSMPNLNPVPDTWENLKAQLDIIERDACIRVYPYGSITKGERGEELSDMEDMAGAVAGYSDDGRGVQSADMIKSAMLLAKKLGKIIVAHCEDNSLLFGGYIHDGEYAKAHGHKGICSESEFGPIERDIELLKKTGASYHVCHISTKESVDLIRRAKAEGVDITCETGPHYLVLTDADLKDEGRFKMNPPLRSEADRQALIDGISDGTIDMIATDHAPHSAEEKSKGLLGSAMGITGIETAFSVLYTNLVRTGIITLERLIELLVINPRARFGIGGDEDFTVFNLDDEFTINSDNFISLGKSTPFEGDRVFGKCLYTSCKGVEVYNSLGGAK